jgi:hypothetical protein
MTLTRADFTDRERELADTCFHEAGHAVACTVLGGRIAGAVIFGDTDGALRGKTVYRDLPEGAWPSIVYGGPWAEARWRAGRRPTLAQVFDVLDSTARTDRAELLASGGTAAGAGIDQLLERCWSAICELAAQLHRWLPASSISSVPSRVR